ncbi:response regulator transcription factor [Streptomyces sp. NPDC052042]|uniref:response regulator transcription factor n=1 Tax=Streptomyces sp. NPDC052042 TaxID=3365683 RepID=UPI0037D0E4D5
MDLKNSKQITVVVVDDDPMARVGTHHVVNAFSGTQVVTTTPGGRALSTLEEHAPNLVLVGAGTASPDHNPSLFEQILRSGHHAVLLFGITGPCFGLTPELVAAGLSGALLSNAAPEEFERAIRTVHAGYVCYPRAATDELVHRRVLFPDLSPREREVLDLLADGFSNRRIARALGVKEATIKVYVTRVLEKLNVESRLQACLRARGLPVRAL